MNQSWEKLGKIFDIDRLEINGEHFQFAQSPQVLQFDSFIRIYFSTRRSDRHGKFVSEVTFVDFNDRFDQISDPNVVAIKAGPLGAYDEHGVFPLHVHRLKDSRIIGYVGGWNRRSSVSMDGAIGISESVDQGKTFTRLGPGPALGASLNEPFLIGDPFVLQVGEKYRMWYIFGTKWTKNSLGVPERTYKIGSAESQDGISWLKTTEGKQIIPEYTELIQAQVQILG
jgi:hypothetical protein